MFIYMVRRNGERTSSLFTLTSYLVYSSLAQSVEHLTVNQGVVGSSPTGGAIYVVRKDYYTRKVLDFQGLFVFLRAFFSVEIFC